MKTIKSVLKKVVIGLILFLCAIALTIGGWETVRPTVMSKFDGETYVSPIVVEPATEFELYVASEEVQEMLQLEFMKHQRKMLDDEIAKKLNLE